MLSRTNTITASLLAAAAPLAHAQLPEYVGVELQARAIISSSNNYNLPAFSSTVGTSPAINDSRQVTFQFLDANGDNPIWAGQGGSGGPITQPFFSATDSTINASGQITWANNISGTTGIFQAPFSGPAEFVGAGFSSYARPEIADDGTIGFRGEGFSGQQYVAVDPGDGSTTTYAEAAGDTDFLFTPNYNNSNQMAGKVLLTNGQEELRRYEPGSGFNTLATQSAQIEGFDNSPDLNDNGRMGFIANLDGGERGVGIADDSGVSILADTSGTLSDIAFFSPRLNNSGIVTFRATEPGLGEGIYVASSDGLERVIGIGDEVMTDQGLAEIDSFSGSPDINNPGDVAFNAGVTAVSGTNLGGGVFVAQVPAPATSAALIAGGIALSRRRRA